MDDDATLGDRINPHIVTCLTKLEEQAKKKGYEKQRVAYTRALRAAQRYPIALKSGNEAKVLDGVGPVLAQKIDQYLIKKGVLSQSSIPRKEKTQKKKSYDPKYRSAAWALLIVLYRNLKKSTGYYKGKMTKNELVAAASPLSDTPMSASGGGRLQYSGWNCMKGTLMEKKLAICHRRMKPHRFALTPAGRTVARRLHLCERKMAKDAGESDGENDFNVTDTEDNIEIKTPKKLTKKQEEKHDINLTLFSVSYANSALDIVESKDDAGVQITDNDGLLMLVRVMVPNASSVDKVKERFYEIERQDDNIVFAWIKDEHAPQTSQQLFDVILPQNVIELCSPKKPKKSPKRKKQVLDDDDEEPPRKQTKIDFTNFRGETATQETKKLFSPHYELILLIDQREKANRDRKYIFNGVSKQIPTRISQLSLGDMVWIAKDGDREVILDFIVERKSIGDLASSIIDGRYQEQRYRLRESGITNVLYIIEGDSLSQGRMPQQDFESELVKLTMTDGFYMRRTGTVDMTIELLVQMTQVIREILDTDGIDMHVYVNDSGDDMQLSEFNATMGKNKTVLTTKEIFGRQLRWLEGCSVRVVESILDTYRSPRELVQAFEKEGVSAIEKHIVKSNFGTSAGRIGKLTRSDLFEFYTCKEAK
jgi:ERCC4-type nuclease